MIFFNSPFLPFFFAAGGGSVAAVPVAAGSVESAVAGPFSPGGLPVATSLPDFSAAGWPDWFPRFDRRGLPG